jgi:hypothetical protein
VAAGLVAFGLSVPAIATASSRRVCDAHQRGAALVTRFVVVYRVGFDPTTYFACWRPSGSGVVLGDQVPSDPTYGSGPSIAHFRAAGAYVAAEGSSGDAGFNECSKYGDSRTCPPPTTWIRVVEASTRRQVDLSGHDLTAGGVVSGAGALAWLEASSGSFELWATSLDPRGRRGFATAPSIIDRGAVDPGSLRFVGRTLSWARDGDKHRQVVPHISSAVPERLSWSPPVLIEPASGILNGLSCPSALLCVAVDSAGNVISSTDPSGGVGAWRSASVDGTGRLVGVSCASPSMCVAVDGAGNAVSSTHPTGGSSAWTISPADSMHGLEAVSCPSVSLCVAVGGDDIATSTNPVGGSGGWQVAQLADPNFIFDVSCATATLCLAVDVGGNVLTSTNPTGGSSAWTLVHFDYPLQGLDGVACASASTCVAVDSPGENLLTSTDPTAGASTWKLTSGYGYWVRSASCPAPSLCVLVGDSGAVVSIDPAAGPFAWRAVRAGPNALDGVSCPSVSLCVAVDTVGDALVGRAHTSTQDQSTTDAGLRGRVTGAAGLGPSSRAPMRPLRDKRRRCCDPRLERLPRDQRQHRSSENVKSSDVV